MRTIEVPSLNSGRYRPPSSSMGAMTTLDHLEILYGRGPGVQFWRRDGDLNSGGKIPHDFQSCAIPGYATSAMPFRVGNEV